MPKKAIPTVPLPEDDQILLQKFAESITAQSELMDKLAGHLLTLELAIPGIYATLLKMIAGDQAVLIINWAFYPTFGCWLAALGLTLAALFPRKWRVIPGLLRQDPEHFAEGLGVEDFFHKSARYKRNLLFPAAVLFFSGIIFSVFN